MTISLISRNTLYSGVFFEGLRGLSLILCGLSGLMMVFAGDISSIFKKYWVLLGYIFSLFCSTIFSDDYLYVAFQFISLVAIFLFAIGFYNKNSGNLLETNSTLINTVFYVYSFICLISILVSFFDKNTAYEILYGGEVRFRGVFPKSGMMGASAGLLFGCGVFIKKNKFIRYTAILFAVICLALTLSRTFWVSSLVSLSLTLWIYKPRLRKLLILNITFGAIFLSVLVMIFSENLNFDDASKITRADSISNLSGRLSLWEDGLSAAGKKPILGYGLTAGSAAIENSSLSFSSDDDLDKSRQRGKRTLHSGYIQSLLDSGLLGITFYVLIIILSIKNIYKMDFSRKYPIEFYSIIFLAISNFSENIIYAVSVFNSIYFWLLAAFTMSLPKAALQRN